MNSKFRKKVIVAAISIVWFLVVVQCLKYLNGINNKRNEDETSAMKKETYHRIADLVGITTDKQWFIDDPARYYNDNSEMFMERCIEEDDDEDTIIWISIVDEMILENKAWEFDWKAELEDFTYGMEQILPDGLTVNEDSLNEDDSIPDWTESINSEWANSGYVIACFDIDSDSYVIFVCKKDIFEQLQAEAVKVDHKIDIPQNL